MAGHRTLKTHWMQQREEDSFAQHVQMFLKTLYKFICNYQGYAFINFIILGLNMTFLWVINYNVHKRQSQENRSLMFMTRQQARLWQFQHVPRRMVQSRQNICAASKKHVATEKKFPAVTKTRGQKDSPPKSGRKSFSKSPKKSHAVSEDEAETLDEITWGNDDSVSPVFSPKAVRHSEGFFHSSPKRVLSAGLKQKVESPQRQNKVVSKTVLSKSNQHLVIDKLDKRACKSISPRNSISTMEVHMTNNGFSPSVNLPAVDVTLTKKLNSCKRKIKAPAKIKGSAKRSRKHTDFLVVKPLVSKYPTRDKEKTNSEPTKSCSGLRRSPSSRHMMKKFTKKRSQLSSNWNVEKPYTVIVSVSSSDDESPRSSSGMDQQSAPNRSDSSIVLKRDSWIWFSPETRPSAENFASRQRKFRSLDPRVDALAEKIRRQEELNRDIERTAESLVDSSSHSTANAATVGTMSRTAWQRGKCSANRGNIYRRSTSMPYTSASKLNHTRKCVASPNRGTLPAPNPWSTTPRSASFCDFDKHRVKVGNTKRLADRYNRKVCGVKLSVEGRSKKADCMRTSCRQGDKTNDITLSLETDDIKTPDIEVQSLTTNEKVSDSHRGLFPVSSNELLESTELGPSFRHYPKQWVPYDGHHNDYMPDLLSATTSFTDVNTLDVCASSTNSQYPLPFPESGRGSSMISTSRDSTQLQSRIHRESLELCERQECCRASSSNSLRLQPEPRVERSFRSPAVGPSSNSHICRQLQGTRATDGSCPDSYPNPDDLAEKMACDLPISSWEKQPVWLRNYYCQLVAKSNLRASEHHQDCITTGGVNSQVAVSSQDCKAINTDKPELGQTCLEEIISAEVTAIIHKLLLESECGTTSFVPSCALENNSAVPCYEMCKSLNSETQNFLVSDNISPATSVVQYPASTLTVPHSQGATSKSLTESLNSVRSDCADTYLLDSTQSKRKDDRRLSSNFSCLETKTKNEKRINIYSRAYYLGKRAALNKKQEKTKTLLQTRPKASLSQWKKPYITWSKTVSLHLYSPTNKLSPRSQLQQKKYEQYMRKLKPCLKVPHTVAEQSPKCTSLSEGSLHLGNGVQSVASDSTLMQMADLETDAFSRSNCQAPFSSAPNPDTKQHDAVRHVQAKQTNILPCTSARVRKHSDLIWNHLSAPKTPAHTDVSARTASRKPAAFGRQTAGVTKSFTASNCCRKAGASGRDFCRPVTTFSNNNSSSSVLPYQSPTPVVSERLDPQSSQVNQLFFVTQTKTWPNQVCLQNTHRRLPNCHHQEDPENSEIYKTSSKMCSLRKVNFQSVHSVGQDTQESLRNPADNIVLSEHKMCEKRGFVEEFLLRPHSFKGQTEGVAPFHKHKMTIYENATENHYSDICVTTATNDIISSNPHFLKSCLLKQQVPSTATKKQDLLMPLVKMLSPMTSSDEEHSLSDEFTAENHGISRGEQTRPTSSTSDSYTYYNYRIPAVSSVGTNVSNPDSGFDEPLSDTVCLDNIVELFPADYPKQCTSPARYRSMVDSKALAEARCRSLVDSTALTEARCLSEFPKHSTSPARYRSLVDSTALTGARCLSEFPKHSTSPARYRSLVDSKALAEARCRSLVDSTALTEARCLSEFPKHSTSPARYMSLVDSTALTEARCLSEFPKHSTSPARYMSLVDSTALTETRCLSEFPKHSTRPARYMSLVDSTALTEARCLSEFPKHSTSPARYMSLVDSTALTEARCLSEFPKHSTSPARYRSLVDSTALAEARRRSLVDSTALTEARFLSEFPKHSTSPARYRSLVDSTALTGARCLSEFPKHSTSPARYRSLVDSTALAEARCLSEFPKHSTSPARYRSLIDSTALTEARCLSEFPKHSTSPARYRSLVDSTALAEARRRSLVDCTALAEARCRSLVNSTSLGEAKYRSLVDSTALAEAGCQSESPCSDVSQVSEPLQGNNGSAKLSECAPERDYMNSELDNCESECDAFNIAYDTLDMRCGILGIDEGFLDAESAKNTARNDTFDTEYDKFYTEYKLNTENVKFSITYDKFNSEHDTFNRENGQFNTGHNNLNNEHDGFNTENNMFNIENVKSNVSYCNFSSKNDALNTEHEKFNTEHNMFNTENDNFNTEHDKFNTENSQLKTEYYKLNNGKDKFNTAYNELNTESANENTEHERFKTESSQIQHRECKAYQ